MVRKKNFKLEWIKGQAVQLGKALTLHAADLGSIFGTSCDPRPC